ncbi:MAG: succinylglutamate desuccinylase/aspartoacylase family protein [Verrucomicrobia bacterium]|nr:succinylglutamate desuccinylase/aspartoacylase family protein [Verrucomicrobiota bacterium]
MNTHTVFARRNFIAGLLAALAFLPLPHTGRAAEIKVELQPRRTWDFPKVGVKFNNEFSGARLNGVEQTGDHEFTLTINPENRPINTSPWYAFQVGAAEKQTVSLKFHLTYRGTAALPKLSHDGVNWTRLDTNAWMLAGTNRVAKLTIGPRPLWVFAHEPFGLKPLNAWMDAKAKLPFARGKIIGESIEHRPLRQFTLGETANANFVFIIGRQHPPEITGTIGLMSFVDTIAGDSQLARNFRKQFQTVVIPLVNPDGVEHGHWRSTLGGLDSNRDWAKFTQPEPRATSRAISALAKSPGARAFLFVDFHSTGEDVFYTQKDDEPTFPKDFTKQWMAAIRARFPDYKFKRDAGHNVSQPTSKHWAWTTLGCPGITYEFGYNTDRALVRKISAGAAEEMMKLLLKEAGASAGK